MVRWVQSPGRGATCTGEEGSCGCRARQGPVRRRKPVAGSCAGTTVTTALPVLLDRTDSPPTRTRVTFTTRPMAALVAFVTRNTEAAFPPPAAMSFLSRQLTVSAALRVLHGRCSFWKGYRCEISTNLPAAAHSLV